MAETLALVKPLGETGAVLLAVATAAVFVLRSAQAQAGAMVLVILLAPALLVGEVYSSGELSGVPENARLAIVAVVVGVAAIVALVLLFSYRPGLFPVLAVAAIPFRVPIAFGETSANLLAPLYLVVIAGCISYLAGAFRSSENKASTPRAGYVEWAVAVFIVVYALQALYSLDFSKALDQLVFFFVPFALLFKLLLKVNWTFRLVAYCGAVAVSLAVVFSLIGFWEYEARHLFWNSKVIDANKFSAYFRVNSVFFDPNIFGRFLAVAMLAVVTALLWDKRRSHYPFYALTLAILWGGLLITFSQSSFGALLVGLAVLAGLRWSVRWTAITATTTVVLGVAFVLLFHSAINLKIERFKSIDYATSGRLQLVRGGVDLFAERPLFGYGSGSFSRAFRKVQKTGTENVATASHNIAVTSAAEQGVVGFAAYLFLLVTALVALFARLRAPPGTADTRLLAARCAIAAIFVAIVFHTMVYAAFLEDPTVWFVLGIGLALSRLGGPVEGTPERAAEGGRGSV